MKDIKKCGILSKRYKTNNPNIVYLDWQNKDQIKAVSNLHIKLFPESILAKLGFLFLTKFYYLKLIKDKSIEVYLYIQNDEYVGFMACTNEPFTFIKNGVKRYFFLISIIVGLSIILKPKRLPALLNFIFQLKRDTLLGELYSEYGISMGQFLSFGVVEEFRKIIDPIEKLLIPDVLMNHASRHFITNNKKYAFGQIVRTNLKVIFFYLKHSGTIVPSDNPNLVTVIKQFNEGKK